MLSALLTAPCELKLHLLQHYVFLRPMSTEATEDTEPTTTDEVFRGLVELYVPSDRRIDGIRVKLRAVQSVAILPDQRDNIPLAAVTPIAWEDTVLMEKVVEYGIPPQRSHATVPGDDSVSTDINVDRRSRSRHTTPSDSRQVSPRQSRDGLPSEAPPRYEECAVCADDPCQHQSSANGQTTQTGALSAALHAIARGRPQSRPSSRQASREGSPADVRPSSSAQPPSARASPEVSRERRSSRRRDTSEAPPHLIRGNSDERFGADPSDADIATLNGHFSRTGLSLGRTDARGLELHASDQSDQYGIGPTTSSGGSVMHGRGGVGNRSAQRSNTVSPQRSFASKPREEHRPRLSGLTKRIRAPSMDAKNGPATRASDGKERGFFLEKGTHGLEFAFIIPANSPPYERSPFGRVRYVVKATALGAGRARTNLETFRDFFPLVNPAADGGPTPLSVLFQELHPTVGLLSIACTSATISVGGMFNIDIHSPTPPEDLIVYLVRVSIETTIELRTRKKGKQHVPTQRQKLYERGYVPPKPSDPRGPGDGVKEHGLIRDPYKAGSRPDDAWTVQGVARMPNDNVMRASTTPQTPASIRFTHQLLVEVVHSRQPEDPTKERKVKVFALRQPVTIPSCCVAFDAGLLPAYSASDDNARLASMPYDIGNPDDSGPTTFHFVDERGRHNSQRAPTGGASTQRTPTLRRPHTAARLTGPGQEHCACGASLADLTDRERSLMPARPVSELPIDGLSHRKIGELPPPRGRSDGLAGALHRHTSRSSSSSRDGSQRRERSVSIGRRGLSIAQGMTRARSPSVSSVASGRVRQSSASGTRRRSPSSSRPAGRGVPPTGRRGSDPFTVTDSQDASVSQAADLETVGETDGAPPAYQRVPA